MKNPGGPCIEDTPLVNSTTKTAWAYLVTMMSVLFLASPGFAQDEHGEAQVHIVPVVAALMQTAQPAPPEQSSSPGDEKIIVPRGTKLSLALARAISIKHTKPGDNINLQVVFPLTLGARMVIPPGTYVQGVIDQVTRTDRRYENLAARLRSAEVIFSNGYTVTISGPMDMNPTYGRLAPPPAPGKDKDQVPVMAAAGAGPVPPPLPPLPGPSMGALIGIGFGSAAAIAVTGIVIHNHRDFWMQAGTPVEISLPNELVLNASSVNAAVEQFAKAPPQIVQPAPRMRTCWTTATSDYPSTPYPCP